MDNCTTKKGCSPPASNHVFSIQEHAPHWQAAISKKLMAQKFIDRLSINEGSKVLDLGCGNGDITALLAEKVGSKGHVTGVDPNSGVIKTAKQQNKNTNVSFHEGDAESFPSDQYDLVFSNYVSHFVENKQAMFENVSRNLRPGGQFAFVAVLKTPQLGHELSLCMGSDVKREIDRMPGFFMCPTETYDELAVSCGFEVTLKEEDNDVFLYPNLSVVFKFWPMCTAGKFNPEKADQNALAKLKERHGDKPVEWSIQVVRYVLTKK